MSRINDTIAEVTERIGGRSAAARGEYLERTRKRKLVEPARRLAALAQKSGDEAMLRFALDRVVALDPFDAAAHSGSGRLALKGKNAVIAAREFKAALLTNVPDKATAHCDLAEAYLMSGRTADAKKEALAALEIAPTFERAQDLLLRAVEGK